MNNRAGIIKTIKKEAMAQPLIESLISSVGKASKNGKSVHEVWMPMKKKSKLKTRILSDSPVPVITSPMKIRMASTRNLNKGPKSLATVSSAKATILKGIKIILIKTFSSSVLMFSFFFKIGFDI